MRVSFQGAGIWTRGLKGYADFQRLLLAERPLPDLDAPFEAPRCQAIAPRERRRAGLAINLAVAVAHEACERAAADKQTIASVFTSAMGDTSVTDYMCRKLASAEKLLSPTRFHNSVHNAPSGYWTISTGNRAPSTFVGGFTHSFGAALFETASLALAQGEPVLLVAYDIADGAPFFDFAPISESLGVALVVAPATAAQAAEPNATLSYRICQAPVQAQAPVHLRLAELADANPLGESLALLERLCLGRAGRERLEIRCAPGAVLDLAFEA